MRFGAKKSAGSHGRRWNKSWSQRLNVSVQLGRAWDEPWESAIGSIEFGSSERRVVFADVDDLKWFVVVVILNLIWLIQRATIELIVFLFVSPVVVHPKSNQWRSDRVNCCFTGLTAAVVVSFPSLLLATFLFLVVVIVAATQIDTELAKNRRQPVSVLC